jgi:hypothetical protein
MYDIRISSQDLAKEHVPFLQAEMECELNVKMNDHASGSTQSVIYRENRK